MERRYKDPIQERAGLLHREKELVKPRGVVAGAEHGGSKSRSGAERAAALLRAQRSLSPEGHRSSSLPPPAHRSIPTATPSKSFQSFYLHLGVTVAQVVEQVTY